MLPVTVVGGDAHEAGLKLIGKVLGPVVTVRTKLIGPQAKVDEVLTVNGTLVAPAARFGYVEFGWEITTPGVDVESTADTPVMLVPLLIIVTLSELHSLRSMTPFPLPPETT